MSFLINYILVVFIFVLVAGGFLHFFLVFQRIRFSHRQKRVVLQLKVPKESESGPIVMEQVYATLHGVNKRFSFVQRLKGFSTDSVSFEIASMEGSIRFYVVFPYRLRNLVEGQIYAQYPDVEILEVKDYVSSVRCLDCVVGTELTFTAPDVFPIKRYPQFEDKLTRVAVDPIAGITSSMVRFSSPSDKAFVQILVTPLEDKWRVLFTKCLRLLKKGVFSNSATLRSFYVKSFITRKPWVRVLFFPIYLVFWFQGVFVNVENDAGSSGANLDEALSGAHERENDLDAGIDKVVRPLFFTTIRLLVSSAEASSSSSSSVDKLREVSSAFRQFNAPHLNGFEMGDVLKGRSFLSSYKNRLDGHSLVLNNEELATIFHLPNYTVKTPTIYWVQSRKLEPPFDIPSEKDDVTVLGRTNFRGNEKVFGVKTLDRRRHIYVIGKTGMGKSTLLENMIFSDIERGRGVGVIDPHGDLADAVLRFVPKSRINDVLLIDPADNEYAVAFNMLENVDPALRSIVASGLVGIFKKIYADSWGPRLEHILRNTILSLLEYPGTTMLGILRILQDSDYRKKVVKKIDDPVVKSFWLDEFEMMKDRFRVEAISPIQNKVGQFLSSPTIRNIVGQVKSTVDLRFAMDTGKIVIVNLSKGKIGEDNSALLGSMFITKFQLDAMSRANIPENERRDFYLYVDEFQNFATESFATILSEARKYHLNLTMANQYIAQMPDEVRDAVFGNVGTTFAFQVGFDDAEYVSRQFGEEVLPSDLVSLSKYTVYMRLLIDGMPSKTFSLDTLPPPVFSSDEALVKKIVKVSRERYSQRIDVIEDKIKRWSSNKGALKHG